MILDAEFSDFNLAKAEIYTIQVYFPKKDFKTWKIWEYESESDLVESFIDWFLYVPDKLLIGYNILKTDIPLLLMKAQKTLRSDEFFLKINRCNIVDLHVILTFLNPGEIKGLKAWCKEFKIPYEPPLTGNRIPKFFKQKLYDEIEEYIKIESEAISKLHSKLFKKDILQTTLKSLKQSQ